MHYMETENERFVRRERTFNRIGTAFKIIVFAFIFLYVFNTIINAPYISPNEYEDRPDCEPTAYVIC